MSKAFRGSISTDIRDSVPDWAPFEPPAAPEGAPNVVYIVLDDVGFSALSSYGGPIETPNIDRIAADGVRYTQWHTTALCSPTRSCLLTGRNHTRNSMACITEAAVGFPNASGTIPPENGMGYRVVIDLSPAAQPKFDQVSGWPADLKAREAAAERLASLPPAQTPRIASAKFLAPVRPGAQLQLRLQTGPRSLRFEVREGDRIVSTGQFEVAP